MKLLTLNYIERKKAKSPDEKEYKIWQRKINALNKDKHEASISAATKEEPCRFFIYNLRGEPLENLVAETFNDLKLAGSQAYTIFLRTGDQLRDGALAQISLIADQHNTPSLIYADHDRLDRSGQRHQAHFKPDWNEELFLSTDYVDNAFAVRCDLLCDILSDIKSDDDNLPFEVFLRATRRNPKEPPRHIPDILFHLQQNNGTNQHSKIALLTHVLDGDNLEFSQSPLSNEKTNIIDIRARADTPQKVTIIIPTRDRADLMSQILSGLYDKTDYENFEVLVVDNESQEASTHSLFQKYSQKLNFTVISCPGTFNFSKMMNLAVTQANGSLLCLLNNDIEIQDPNWLKEMVGWAVRKDVGAVGAKLLYPDRRIQHAGVVMGLAGVAGHAFKTFDENDLGYHGRIQAVQEFSAVTAACLVVEKTIYNEVGGFNEESLAIAFNDVDFCLRLYQNGYRNIYTPLACLIHHESVSRGKPILPKARAQAKSERDYLAATWEDMIANDPHYSPHLSRLRTDFSIARMHKPL